jgi:hypothetical protein
MSKEFSGKNVKKMNSRRHNIGILYRKQMA